MPRRTKSRRELGRRASAPTHRRDSRSPPPPTRPTKNDIKLVSRNSARSLSNLEESRRISKNLSLSLSLSVHRISRASPVRFSDTGNDRGRCEKSRGPRKERCDIYPKILSKTRSEVRRNPLRPSRERERESWGRVQGLEFPIYPDDRGVVREKTRRDTFCSSTRVSRTFKQGVSKTERVSCGIEKKNSGFLVRKPAPRARSSRRRRLRRPRVARCSASACGPGGSPPPSPRPSSAPVSVSFLNSYLGRFQPDFLDL